MTVQDALDLIHALKKDCELIMNKLQRDPWSVNAESLTKTYRKSMKEIERLEELLYKTELDDSYDQNTGEYK